MHQLAVTLLTAKLYACNAYVINDEDAFEEGCKQYGEEFEHVIERIMFDGEKPDIQAIF